MNATNLKTEYLRDPMGIDIVRPRLFWNCQGSVKQTAYEIAATVDGEAVWDSGKVESGSMRCVWNGPALKSRDRVIWKVCLWDENDVPGQWSEARFEMGLLDQSDWTAQWITGDYVPKTRRKLLRAYTGGKAKRYPVDCFRKVFSSGEIVKARLYITACGLYEARINGERVGAFVLAPGYTDYRKRVQYQTYDVTRLVRKGENALTVMLADGWYRGAVGAWGLLCEYGYETRLLAQLELTDSDGNMTVICTDGTWSWSNDGPMRFADNKDGEVVDARMSPAYGGMAKHTAHPVIPSASNNVPVTEHETLKPTVITTPAGKTVLDFGQNIAGYVSFTVSARAGQRVFLRFGEMLDSIGEFTQKNIQVSRKGHTSPRQQVTYICADGRNTYKTTFAVFGFQYVLLETDVQWKTEDFTAIAVYSDIKQTGWFESSNPLLDRFVENTVWSGKNNFLDVPTDCPTRERHGWTGDIQIFTKTATYLFDFAPFARKYLNDVYDAQHADGCLPQIAPVGGTDFFMKTMDGSVGWADVGVLMPYHLWKQYGDRSVLEQYYEGMKRYVRFMQKRCGKKTLISKPLKLRGEARKYAVNYGQCYGEWAEPAQVHPNHWADQVFPHPEEETAYTCFVMEHMAKICQELHKDSEAKAYQSFANKVRKSYQALSELPDFTLDTDRQARLARPLHMGLLNEKQTAFAKDRLLKALDAFDWRLGTGFLTTPLILYVLADIDIEAAYRLLENEEMPGWLFMPKAGANTIWESWEGTAAQGGIASLDHYSKGALCEWLFAVMCGIQVAGENHFVIAPKPGGHFEHAKVKYDSIYGTVESGWVRDNGKIIYTVTVPENCTAEVILPAGKKETVIAGAYTFEEG